MDNKKVKGYAYGVIASVSYGLNPLFALPLYASVIRVDSVLFYRYVFALLFLAVMMKMSGQSFALKRSEILPVAVMGLLFSFSSLFLFQSFNYMDAGIASTILFMYPVLVAVIMAVFFKEKLSVVKIASIATAFVGISMLYKGEGGATLSMTGVCLAVYRWREPFFLKRDAGAEAYVLCHFIRFVGLYRPSARRDGFAVAYGRDAMDECVGTGFVPVSDIHGDHCESHPEHRCHAGCHSRSVGAAYGIVRRCHGIPREAYGRQCGWHLADTFCRDADCSRAARMVAVQGRVA